MSRDYRNEFYSELERLSVLFNKKLTKKSTHKIYTSLESFNTNTGHVANLEVYINFSGKKYRLFIGHQEGNFHMNAFFKFNLNQLVNLSKDKPKDITIIKGVKGDIRIASLNKIIEMINE